MTALSESPTLYVLEEVRAERARQDEKWGEQNHLDGTGEIVAHLVPYRDYAYASAVDIRAKARVLCQTAPIANWRDILTEEVFEAFAEDDPERLRAELVQVAAVAVQWVEAIDRRGGAR